MGFRTSGRPRIRRENPAAEIRRTLRFFSLGLCLFALPTHADGLSDAKAGMDSLNAGDFNKAVTLFTRAITKGKLSHDDLELAYVKRAQAYIGVKKGDLALIDLGHAESLNPDDADVADLRFQAKLTLNARGGTAPTMIMQSSPTPVPRVDCSQLPPWGMTPPTTARAEAARAQGATEEQVEELQRQGGVTPEQQALVRAYQGC